jgi:chromosome partitioning protein
MLDGRSAHIIVLGNEKGGSGKSTVAMHLIAGLLHGGHRVASLDLDGRQQTLTRFAQRRKAAAKDHPNLLLPDHKVVLASQARDLDEAQADERERLGEALAMLAASNDFVVIDGPGADTYLSRLAHTFADTLITPVNDSLVDLDPLVTVSGGTYSVDAPGHYTEMVWQQRRRRSLAGNRAADWIVMRNRLTTLNARNKRRVEDILDQAAARYGFRVLAGFTERVIYRELFLAGLTVLDLPLPGCGIDMSMSHVTAKQEVRSLATALRLPATAGHQAIAV